MQPLKPHFENLIPNSQSIEQTFHERNYLQVPIDWFVVVTDVNNSTKAIEAGKYRDINAIGGSTIAAVVNATKPRNIPYIFGGDGASFCVPPELIEPVKQALRGCQDFSESSSQLLLRVGIVPVEKLNNPVLVSRFSRGETLVQFFFLGGGLEEADHLIKSTEDFALDDATPIKVDFSGFECRWNEIPSTQDMTFSLIVKPRIESTHEKLAFYRSLTHQLNVIMPHNLKAPLSIDGLNLSFNTDKLNVEASSRNYGKAKGKTWLEKLKIRFENIIGTFWMFFKISHKGYNWGNYKRDLINNSDYEKIDDAYRTVLSANHEQFRQLQNWLDEQYQNGLIFYGCHQSHSALITCLIQQTGTHHIHFVDSTNGGYAVAAKQMKAQIKSSMQKAE